MQYSIANINQYVAKLRTIKIKISNLRCLMKEKLKSMEKFWCQVMTLVYSQQKLMNNNTIA